MLYLIPTPIGNLDDISRRSLELLRRCTTFFCEDTRITGKLLQLLEERTGYTFGPKKLIALHAHNESRRLENLDPALFEADVAYMSDAGMPCISDPGALLVAYAQAHAIPYTVLPGANAALLAYVASGFSGGRFVFYGFLPHKGSERQRALHDVLTAPWDAILYESPHRIMQLAEELKAIEPERELFALKEATKHFESMFRGSALAFWGHLEHANSKGEWCVVIAGKPSTGGGLVVADILALDLPPKQKAKLLAKLTGEETKTLYKQLLQQDS